ncbi:threonine synthase, partial [Salmonella enterica subsp. enterica serovar Enteritidis]|nr:threonine synthase [Salmonella enterica subsp. enterica serovar Enteritidis]
MYRAFLAGAQEVTPVVAEPTQASAIRIGNPVSAPRAMAALRGMNGVVEEATESELADACARADRTGLYADPHTG